MNNHFYCLLSSKTTDRFYHHVYSFFIIKVYLLIHRVFRDDVGCFRVDVGFFRVDVGFFRVDIGFLGFYVGFLGFIYTVRFF